jgi:hypothetical protein
LWPWSWYYALRDNTTATRENTARLQQLTRAIEALLDVLKRPPNPKPISLTITAENQNVLTFTINLPASPPEPNDIASGELVVTIDGGAPAVFPTTKDQVGVEGLTGNQGVRVLASFVHIDDAGNKSVTPASLDVVLNDTIPPADPGALGLTVTAES